MIEAGERSGSLHLVLRLVAEADEKAMQQRARLQSALVYPLFTVSCCLLVLGLGPGLLLAQQQPTLDQLNIHLPWATRLLTIPAQVLLSWPFAIGLVVVVGVASRRPDWRQAFMARVIRRCQPLPGVAPAFNAFLLSRFCRCLALQIRAGLSLPESLELATTVDTRIPGKSLVDGIIEGSELYVCLEKSGRFPSLVVEMTRVGEESGRLDAMLSYLADFYEFECNHRIDLALSLLQPLVIAVIGLVTGCALILTLYPMVAALRDL
jgi:type IV pilus assembly protein PilC